MWGDVFSARLGCHTRRLRTPSTNHSTPHRFPAESISSGVWLYCRFCLSDRDGEALRCARGSIVTDEAIRQWGRPFGQPSAHHLRRRRPRAGAQGHLDEVFLTSHGQRSDRWRALAPDGPVLEILVQGRRDKKAAKTCFRTLLTGLTYVPRVLITAHLESDGAATRELLPGVEQRQQRSLNNRAEHAHQPTRHRDRRMPGCTSAGHAQRCLAAYRPIAPHVRRRRHRWSASADRQARRPGVDPWQAMTQPPPAA